MVDGRKEPRMGDERSVSGDIRVSREDRPAPVIGRSGSKERSAPSRSGERRRPPAAPPPPRKRRKRRSWFFRIFYWLFVLCIWAVLVVGGIIAWYGAHLPPMQSLEVPKRPPNIQILAADGAPMANRGDMGGAAITLKDLPPYVGKAFVAIEDRRFYSHFGLDIPGLARAMMNNLMARHMEQGGSSLTQQLAKNIFLTQERSLERKVQEAILALWLERHYSKDQILEMYINRVYFGAGAYGIEAAAQRYFNKPAKSLSIAQAAMLAGLMKAPSKLAPNKNIAAAQARAQLVVQAMLDLGVISPAEAKAAISKPATVSGSVAESSGNYPADWVMGLLDDYVGPLDGDVIVKTTLNSKLQATAEQALDQALDKSGAKLKVSQGALIAMEPNGAVRALVGGRSYADSQFNRVITAHRQPGSTFKPFVYLAALERGATPDSVRDDAPVTLAGWNPGDFSKEYRGPVKLSTALALSLNTVAVRLCAEVGPKSVVAVAQRLGISSSLQPNPSIAPSGRRSWPPRLSCRHSAPKSPKASSSSG